MLNPIVASSLDISLDAPPPVMNTRPAATSLAALNLIDECLPGITAF